MTIPVTAQWRPHTEVPTPPISALIAIPQTQEDPSDSAHYLLSDLYVYFPANQQRWVHEESGKPIKHPVFWWLNEAELIASLDAASVKPD